MKIIGIIPARYKSSRFEGKPLADIHGKPMIWWVYQQAKKVEDLIEVFVATDDHRIENVCKNYDIPVIMTSIEHKTHIDRVYEVSTKISSDLYVVICGDEPLIEPEVITSVIPKVEIDVNSIYVSNLTRNFEDPVEVIDPANIKVVSSNSGNIVMLSRSPIPYPYKSIMFKYKKLIGVECYNKKALDFFYKTTIGSLEKIEDVTLQRFLENNIFIHTTLVESNSLSVDTPNDLEKVKMILKNRGKSHE